MSQTATKTALTRTAARVAGPAATLRTARSSSNARRRVRTTTTPASATVKPSTPRERSLSSPLPSAPIIIVAPAKPSRPPTRAETASRRAALTQAMSAARTWTAPSLVTAWETVWTARRQTISSASSPAGPRIRCSPRGSCFVCKSAGRDCALWSVCRFSDHEGEREHE